MCPDYFLILTSLVFAVSNVAVCVLSTRFHSSFHTSNKKWAVVSTIFMFVVGIALGFHCTSTCARSYITWGSITFGLLFCLTLREWGSVIFTSPLDSVHVAPASTYEYNHEGGDDSGSENHPD
jgi:hypothetical protein